MAYKDADMRGYVDIARNYLIIIGLTWCKNWPIDLYLKYGGSVIKCWLYSGKCTWTYRSRSYFAKIDDVAPSDSIIVSSSSDITMSVIQSDCKHPEHCVIDIPFNPPHIIQLFEIVGVNETSNEDIQQTVDFYSNIRKKPIQLRKELSGHAANRLQMGLYK